MIARVALFAAVLCAPLLAPTTARAGGAVLAAPGEQEPAISVRMAVAIGPASTTRWSEVTVKPGPALGWLVPVRPGATIEWAPSAWLASLEGASAARVLVPQNPAPCSLQQSFELTPPWVEPAAPVPAAPIALPASVADVSAWVEGHGLSVSPAETKRLDDLYASGWRVAAVELAASDAPRSSPTLRVTDDGGPILPLSIGVSGVDTHVTLFVIGAGSASIAGTRELDDSTLSWGLYGSSYALVRKQLLGTEGWLRESSSHAALFTEIAVAPRPTVAPVVVSPVVTTYFDDPGCAAEVQSLGARSETQEAAALTCGDRKDLSIALAGIAPASAVLTRLAGVLPAGRAAGTPEIALGIVSTRSSVRRATSYDQPCPADGVDVDPSDGDPSSTSSSSSSPSTGIRPPSSSSGGGGGGGGGGSYASSDTTVYVPSDGCSGGTSSSAGDDDDSSGDGWDSSDSSNDACSGDTSSSSSSDGWDSSDSSDDCSGDTSSSSDGWDKSDSSCTTVRHGKRRGPSPLSRVIMLAVTLLIPLRRLSRRRTGEC